jgi:hypothetical protein
MGKNQYFTEQDCLRIIDSGEQDALDLLRDHCPSVERKFRRLDKAMIALLKEVRQVFPDAEYYTASGGFNLLLGKSHSNDTNVSQQQLAAIVGRAQISDGDF